MSLYNKYRPQNFANLVGQDHIRQTLLHEIEKGSLSHAYLFAGPRGTGKTSTARLIAKALNCEKKKRAHGASAFGGSEAGQMRLSAQAERASGSASASEAELISINFEPCDECDFCTTIKDGSLIDVIEIDAASNRGIDEIRDLKEKIQFAPTRAKSKTYIIDEVHMLTKEAFNALLKTLEEPPENVYFILCTTEVHKIPETIISRCQRFDFKRIDVKTIMTRLNYIAQMEGIEADDAAIDLIARHVEGGLRDAIGLFEQMTISKKLLAEHVRSHLGITGHDTIVTLIDLLEKNDTAKALHLVNEVHREGYDLTAFVREILECLRDRLITGIQQGDNSKTALYLDMIGHFEEARDMLRNTVIPQLPLEIAVIRITGNRKQETGNREEETVEKETGARAVEASEATEETQKAEQETAAELKKEYEMEKYEGNLVKHWPRVLEHVQPPSLRRSLSDAKVNAADDSAVTLSFGSRFHMEKVNSAENRVKIEKALHHLFGKTFKVTCALDTETRPMEKKKAPVKKTEESVVKKALEIFGNDE